MSKKSFEINENIITLKEFETAEATAMHIQNFYKNTKYNLSNLDFTNIYSLHNHGGISEKWVDFEWKYSADFKIKRALLILSPNENMTDTQIYKINGLVNKFSVTNLYTDTEYFWQIIAETDSGKTISSKISSFKTTPGRRIIYLDGIKNVRDLGGIITTSGKPIKQGLLYRSKRFDYEGDGEPEITSKGIEIAKNVLKIKTELDLRHSSEMGISINNTSPIGNDVNYVNLDSAQYDNFFNSEKNNESEIIKLFANYDNYPIIFHCTYGADRSGTVAYVLGALVGAENDELSKDYELTGWRKRIDKDFVNLVNKSMSDEYKGNTLKEKTYSFLYEKLRLTKMELSNIKNILLTDSAVFKSDSLNKPIINVDSKIEYGINYRCSKEISSVKSGADCLKFKKTENGVKIDISLAKQNCGVINFNDSSCLEFEW